MPDGDCVIRGGRVVDATGERVADVLVARRAGRRGRRPTSRGDDESSTPSGCVVAPGLVDLHVHLREPGDEEAETIETGARAAALGGFTAVVAMPNTDAAARRRRGRRRRCSRAGGAVVCDVVSSGCITDGRAGEQLAPMGELYALGVRIFTDDGDCVADAGVMRRALEYAASLPGAVIAQHAEDADPRRRRRTCTRASGRAASASPAGPAAAETSIVARDLELAELTGAPRATSCTSRPPAPSSSCARAKARGLPVTAEAAPHHFTLTDAACAASTRCSRCTRRCAPTPTSPRSSAGLADGTIDAIATDHAPAPARGEGAPVRGGARRACSGSRPRSRSRSPSWSSPGVLTLADALALLSWRPAAIAGLAEHGRPIAPGRRRQPLRDRPRRAVGGRRRSAREQGPQHAVRGPQAHRAGPPHRPARRAGRRRRGGAADERDDRRGARARRRRRRSRARRSAPRRTRGVGDRARWCSTPRCRATRRSSPTRRTRAR